MELNHLSKRQYENYEAGVDEDSTVITRLGLDGLKKQLDQHSRLLTERTEALTGRGISAIEAAAGILAVMGAAGTIFTFRALRA